MNQQDVFTRIQGVLEEALGVDDDEVTPDARLEADLGAESIDYLDINFRLEKEFGIKIDQNELFPEPILTDPQYVKDERVTEAGVAELQRRLPFADLSELERTQELEAFRNAYTVQTLVNFVQHKLKESS